MSEGRHASEIVAQMLAKLRQPRRPGAYVDGYEAIDSTGRDVTHRQGAQERSPDAVKALPATTLPARP